MNPVAQAVMNPAGIESQRCTGVLPARSMPAAAAQQKPAGELVIDRLLQPRH